MAEFYAGIDLGARSSWLCVVDAQGQKQLSQKVPNEPARILERLDRFRPHLHAVIESTFNGYWIVDLLQDHGIDVKLAHSWGAFGRSWPGFGRGFTVRS